jgi:hypothetical protein
LAAKQYFCFAHTALINGQKVVSDFIFIVQSDSGVKTYSVF